MQKPNNRKGANLSAHQLTGHSVNIQGSAAEEWLDSADVKIIFKISDSTLYRLRKSREIPFIKLRGKFYYPKSFFYTSLLLRAKF